MGLGSSSKCKLGREEKNLLSQSLNISNYITDFRNDYNHQFLPIVETSLATWKARASLGPKMSSAPPFWYFEGRNFIHYKRNLAFLFRDTLWARFQLWAAGRTCENRLSHLGLPEPGARAAVTIHGVWEGGCAQAPGETPASSWG